MDESDILARVRALVDEEHALRERLAAGELTDAEEHAALGRAEEELDRCWDLLRQRRARREFGEDPAAATPRPASTVEGYLQ
ncbi:DUF2630 family protein [Vallicoccus soli]|uniref:DUF2630 family protein n=1 Tax=Vallicoccus soli TaxID=2339232 RepID=A0A3A3YU09_9ACTN|nr:DUF2630 family protein [Vallicoccus soli]RJK94213.1 DUF2630 family protein [Vallicoccus soli]